MNGTAKPVGVASEAVAASMTPLQRAFLALESAQARLAAVEAAAREPIAIIGLGCRVPGGGNDADSFWRLMRDGVDAISRVPSERWDIDALYDPDTEVPGRIATREGGFITDVDQFDPGFFGIAPREAQGMDPQQRLLLEVSWEALEHAGQAPDALSHSRTGVYVGVTASDYAYLQLKSGDTALLDAHFTSGVAHSIFSGRLSYLLGLQGPSITIDTACSSSLVAVHLACQALRSGECRLALAGGVNLILAPDLFIALSHSRMLAPDGRCKTFDAAADGFARGEGCGVVVLKRLSDAQADGDRILATIRGSAVNQDGPSSGLTAPNGPAQEAVIRAALHQAGIAPRDVGYIEAHGTGTQLGDPLEVAALGAVFGHDRDPAQPLWLGSVKTNLGHLEAAAGITGLIKIVLSMQHAQLPAHLHFKTPSPHIAWGDLPLRVPTTLSEWMPIDGRRIAGVSSFGFSGTNAHILLEDCVPSHRTQASSPPQACLYTLSAPGEPALAALAARHAAALRGRDDSELSSICFTANTGRAQFACRAAVLARSVPELCAALEALAQGRTAATLRTSNVAHRDPPRIAFLFTGQGAQYPGMAAGLYRDAPAFRAALDECAALLDPQLARPLLEVLFPVAGGSTPLDETQFTQPALFAVEYALAQLWKSWGVEPIVVAGHSVGELVAACIAGVFSLPDALQLIAIRGRLMQSLPGGGGMAAVAATERDVLAVLQQHPGEVSIAAVNGPTQTVISGASAQVDAACERFTARGVRCQRLVVSHAFHSALVEPMLPAFEQAVRQMSLSAPQTRLVSNLTGCLVEATEILRPEYWRRHVREPVRFADSLQTLAGLRMDCVVEVGPHPTLLSFASAVFGEQGPTRVASLRKGSPDWEQLLDAVGSLYLAGARILWRAVGSAASPQLVDLPSYPFQRERCWFQARPVTGHGGAREHRVGHRILGSRLRTAGAEAIYESRVGADDPGFLRHHRVLGRVVLPATAYLDMLMVCGRARAGGGSVSVEDVVVKEAMFLEDDGSPRLLQTVCTASAASKTQVTVSSAVDDESAGESWTTHVTATLRVGAVSTVSAPPLDLLRGRCATAVDLPAFYAGLRTLGLEFGADFRPIRRLWRGDGEALGDVEIGADAASDTAGYAFHPVLLDGCLQVLAAALPADTAALYMPIGIGAYRLHGRPASRCWSHASVLHAEGDIRRADVRVFDDAGRLLAELSDVSLKRVTRATLERMGERWLDESLYRVEWPATPLETVSARIPWVPATLVQQASGFEKSLADSASIDTYDPFLARLESICADYTAWTMRRLGWQAQVGELVRAAELRTRLRIAPRHDRLFGRLLLILEEGGWLRRDPVDADVWQLQRPWVEEDPGIGLTQLAANCPPGAGAEVEMTHRVAAELAEALRGEREPTHLLFPNGSTENAERLYRDSPTARFFNGLMAEFGVLVQNQAAAAGRPLRILEIGGGTGGTTAHLLPRLASQDVEYTFTDIGPLFVARAQERFAGHANTHFEVLDLEKDLLSQGFEVGHYDVVIAANVIHATADLRRTLAKVRQLLVPGGLLAMLEVTSPQRWFDLTVGLTQGWWAFTDLDLRADYPTLSRERWFSLLHDCGFEDSAALPNGKVAQTSLGLQSLIVTRAGAAVRKAAARNWLLVADEGGMTAALVDRLQAQGDACTVIREGDPRQVLSTLASQSMQVTDVIHAGSLDTARWENLDAVQLQRARARGVESVLLWSQALLRENLNARLTVITRGAQCVTDADRQISPAQAPVWGLCRTLALEHPEFSCVCVDLDPGHDPAELDLLVAQLQSGDAERQVALRAGSRRAARLVRMTRSATAQALPASWRLEPETPGSLEHFVSRPHARRVPGPGEVEIAVHASALNFKDVLNALGMYPGDPGPLGGECAGKVVAVGRGVTHVKPGDDVMAVAGGSLASHVIARGELVQRRPGNITVEEAASFSIAFLTARFCLDHLAKLKTGDKILIHAAAGGVGMAAVLLAQRTGAVVFATAGDERKRTLLRLMGVEHVLDSRSAAFAAEILSRTGGTGVDVVLNSLAGDLIDASFSALARGGRFVEIGKRGIKDPAWVEAQARDLRYFIVDWGQTAELEPALIGALFETLVADLESGKLLCLPRQVFPLRDAARAFRFMAQARHTGKIVLRHEERRAQCVRRDGSYLVTGGLSGLGLQVARWLVRQGAARLVLVGRRGVTEEARPILEEFRNAGVDVVTGAVNVADEAAMGELLLRVRQAGPPLRGVVHSAGVLDDATFLQQNVGRLENVFAPKVRGAWLLDSLTRQDSLDWFVLFSSVAGVLGSPGQANHSAANAFLGAMAHERSSRGLPTLSIDWGAWSDVGAAAGAVVADRLTDLGFGALSPAQGLTALQRLLAEGVTQAAVLPIDWARYVSRLKSGASTFLAEIAAAPRSTVAAVTERTTAGGELRQQLADAPAGRRRALLAAFVRSRSLHALGIDPTRPVDPRAALSELGLDSLLAVELRNTLGSALSCALPATLLFDYPSMDAVTDFLLGEVLGVPGNEPAATTPVGGIDPPPGAGLVGSIEALSDDDVDRLIAERAKRGKTH